MEKIIVLSDHATKRLKMDRQRGVDEIDVTSAAARFPGYIKTSMRFRGFKSAKGATFDLILRDFPRFRRVITIIGKGA